MGQKAQDAITTSITTYVNQRFKDVTKSCYSNDTELLELQGQQFHADQRSKNVMKSCSGRIVKLSTKAQEALT